MSRLSDSNGRGITPHAYKARAIDHYAKAANGAHTQMCTQKTITCF